MERKIQLLKIGFTLSFLWCHIFGVTQQINIPIYKNAITANKIKIDNSIINEGIIKNLSIPLTDSTEEFWEEAFENIAFIQFKKPWVENKINIAFKDINNRSDNFKISLIELVFANYQNKFNKNVAEILQKTNNAKLFAMCAEYLNLSVEKNKYLKFINLQINKNKTFFDTDIKASSIINQLVLHIDENIKINKSVLSALFSRNMLYGNIVMYSIQRKNRNYPGIVILKDTNGNFYTEKNTVFFVPQIARSISTLPYYITNGNTPQGIFKMNGFGISKIAAIGSTENIQLMMPFETTPKYFFNDSLMKDTTWTIQLYQKLFPQSIKNYQPLMQTYEASKIGRTEIISHGTTVNPDYYKNEIYYPHTPTQGCLCTKEIWSNVNGKRLESNQQKLIDALKKLGGASGYCVVIELDNQQKPVSINEVLPFINP